LLRGGRYVISLAFLGTPGGFGFAGLVSNSMGAEEVASKKEGSTKEEELV
jgi:hypothetical protein